MRVSFQLTQAWSSLEPDEMRIDGQLQDFWSPLFPAGTVRCRDQIAQSYGLGLVPVQIFGFI
jgi:hypothetical protein